MYGLSVYPITPCLWRWELRYGGALLCCGTALTRDAAGKAARDFIKASAPGLHPKRGQQR